MTEAEIRRNKNYWRDRTVARLLKAERFLDIDTLPVYKKVEKDILNQLDTIYKKGGFFEKLTKTEEKLHIDLLRKKLAKFDIQLEEVYSVNQIRIINRLQALYQQNYWTIAEIAPVETQRTGQLLAKTYKESHYQATKDYHDIGVQGSLDILDKQMVEVAIKSDWSGRNYSESVWTDTRKLAQELPTIISAGLATGESYEKLARRVKDQFGVKKYQALRLIRTEGNFLYNQAELDANTLWDKYEYYAIMDGRTSDICRSRNGKVFFKKDIKVGYNYPPLHVNCRSSVVWLLPNETHYERLRPMKQTNLPFEEYDLDSLQHRDKILPDNDFITARPNKNSRDVYYFPTDTTGVQIKEKLGEKWVSVFIKNEEELPTDFDDKKIKWQEAMKNQYDEKDIRGQHDWNADMNQVGKLKGEALQKEVNRIMTSMPKDYASYDALKKVAKEFYGWTEK